MYYSYVYKSDSYCVDRVVGRLFTIEAEFHEVKIIVYGRVLSLNDKISVF